ncbi:homeobox protein 2-like [Helianthus annuus]|uniref:homeobox protein 2-like n=1 Tax=Helianthus annuus TaxID=4232 RepID=UPI000B8F5103|nr:homeobox protein 2-like [Helianthus annuus]
MKESGKHAGEPVADGPQAVGDGCWKLPSAGNTHEDPFFNIDDLRNAIPDDEPYSVPRYQSPEHVSIHTENSDDRGYYDDRVDDDEDWGYINRGNGYNARGHEDEEFGYQNANYVGDDDYGHGNRRNEGYENNRQPRTNNQRNRNDGYYNNNNNGNPNRIPRFVGGGNQRGNQGRNHGRDERRDERRNERRDDRRDNRRMGDQEVNGPYRRQQPPRGVNDRFRPIVSENDSPIVCGNGSGSNNQTGGDDLSAKMDALLSMQKESQNNIKESHNDIKKIRKTNEIRDKAHEALAKQVGQLAEEMAQIRGSMGKLPSDTTVNPKHQGSSSRNTCEVEVERSIDEEVKSLEVLVVREGKPSWTHQVESLPESIDTKLKPSLVEPPEVELKALPKHLKYAYVG